MMSPDHVTPAVLALLRATVQERRTWVLQGYSGWKTMDRYSARFEAALRRDVVAQARGCLMELPELTAVLVRPMEHLSHGLFVTRAAVVLVHGFGDPACLEHPCYAARMAAARVPDEVLV